MAAAGPGRDSGGLSVRAVPLRRTLGRRDGALSVAAIGRAPVPSRPCRHKAPINRGAARPLNTAADERGSPATGAGPPIKSAAGHVGRPAHLGRAAEGREERRPL